MIPSRNPADYSLEAKAWECLRRNEKFRKVCRAINPNKTKIQDIETLLGRGVGRKFEYIHAFAVMNLFRGETRLSLGTRIHCYFSHAYFERCWHELPESFQAWFEQVEARVISLPVEIAQPEMVPELTGYYHLIAVPRKFGHRSTAEVIAAIKTVMRPVINADSRTFASTGRVYGKKEEWKLYLAFEKWRSSSCKFSAEQAYNIAAHESAGRNTLEYTFQQADGIANPKGSNQVMKRHKRYAKVRDAVNVIDKVIESMFPAH